MSEIQYRTIDGVPGRYFDCPSGLGMLSTDACARSYGVAMSQEGLREGRRVACRACPIGAVHADVPAARVSTSRYLGGMCCARCHGDARRLIRGSICVSCYNREREVLIGRNAKGGRPVNCRPVRSETIGYVAQDGRSAQMRRMDRVSGRLEAVLSILRTETRPIAFVWFGAPVVGRSA